MELDAALSTVTDKVSDWIHGAIAMLPNLVVAALVVAVFWLGARLAVKAVRRPLERISDRRSVNSLLLSTLKLIIVLTGVFMALRILQLDGTVTSLLAGVGILGLALGFAFQDIAANFISGVILAAKRPFDVGDLVRTNAFFGYVDDLELRATIGRTFEGQVVTIPNKDVLTHEIINYTRSGVRRVDIEVGVSYGDDLELAEQTALEAVRDLPGRDPRREPELYYVGFGDSSIDFSLRFWAGTTEKEFLAVRSSAIKAIKAAFDARGITIPFPIRTLDFAAVGGAQLHEVLPGGLRGARASEGPRV